MVARGHAEDPVVQVIDLDTIDVSNLNRQFLFRPEHVSMSKAQVRAPLMSSAVVWAR